MTRPHGFTDLLIPDECGRRALEETLADWREESSRAESAFARAGVDLRASLSLARVFAMVSGAGLRQPEVWRCLLFTFLAAAAVAVAQVRPYQSGLTAPEAFTLLSLAIIGPLGMMASAFGFGLKPHNRFPGITLAAAAVLLIGLGRGVVLPASTQYFREAAAERLTGPGKMPAHTRGSPETASADLLRRALTNDARADSARRAEMKSLAMTTAAPAMLLLGAALRARIHTRRGWRTSQIGGGIAAFAIFVGAGSAGAGLAELAEGAWPWLSNGNLAALPWWTATAVSLLVTLWTSRRPQADAANLHPEPGI